MLYELILISSWLFWVPIVIVGIIVSELLDNNNNGGATVTAIVTALLVVLFTNFNPFTLLKEQPLTVLAGVVAYFLAGTLWSIGKWWAWLKKAARRVAEIEAKHTTDGRLDYYRFSTACREEKIPSEFPVKAKEYASMIIGWMIFWPFSMLWTLINDPVRYAFEHIYNWISGLLQSMSDNAFSDHMARRKAEAQAEIARQNAELERLDAIRNDAIRNTARGGAQ
jgi:hypothetical protein